jgi:hypothetical protein
MIEKPGDILPALFDQINVEKGKSSASLFRSWRNIAGDDLADHSHVVDIRAGRVRVEVDHPGWMQIIQMKKARILKVLKKRYPELNIRDLMITLGNKEVFKRTKQKEKSSQVQKKKIILDDEEKKDEEPSIERLQKALRGLKEELNSSHNGA